MLDIVFVSDYVCPYCLVAKEALRQALIETGLEAAIHYEPLELTVEPRPRVDTYHDEVRRSHYQLLNEPCCQLGLDMKIPPKVIPRPYTRLAFEGWFYALDHGAGDAWNDLMYTAYFMEEKDIGDMAVLAELAGRIGLDAADLTEALDEGRYSEREKAAVEHSRETWKPDGVPTVYINGERVEISEYTKDEMVRILTGAQTGGEGGMSCGPDGCM